MSNSILPPGLLAVRADGGDVAALLAQITSQFQTFRERQDARIASIEANLREVEQRGADRITQMPGARASLAQTLMNSTAWQSIANKAATKTSIEIKAADILNVRAAITYDSDYFDVTERRPEIITSPMRRKWLRSRFPNVAVTGGSVEYHRLLTFTNNAAPQGSGSPFQHEGVGKAESEMIFEPVEQKVATIAHYIKASKQILSDVGMLQMTLDTQLRYGLELKIESQILTGNGAGANMSGLTKVGNHTAFTPTSGDTALDSISRAIAAIEAADGSPNLIVLHPTDFRAMQRLRATGDGQFLFGSANGANAENVWNREVHVTPAMTQGKFLCLDSALAGVVFNRADSTVVVGWVDSDFTKNLVTILCEARLTLAVQRPSVVQYGSLKL